MDWSAVDGALDREAPKAFEFLRDLVAAPSTVGSEHAAQEVVAAQFARLGMDVREVPIPEDTALGAPGGVAQGSYDGRYNVLGVLNAGASPSLLFNGHIDVVPADASTWATDPFTPTVVDGWMYGRGAGDMKCGFAMGSLAVSALLAAAPDALTGELGFLSVIEEECTGNGTLAACRAGVLADAVLALEPTDLKLLLGGVGVLWARIEVDGYAAHAEAADRAVNPVHLLPDLITAFAALEAEFEAEADDDVFAQIAHPYNINVGMVRAGNWPSSVPPRARFTVRVGYPRRMSPQEAFARVERTVAAVTEHDDWFRRHPARVTQVGYRAEGYHLDSAHPLALRVAAAHEAAHGDSTESVVIGSTTDARYYINQYQVPALAYGPTARDIHGTDERVELASIVAGARTLTRFLARYFADGGLGVKGLEQGVWTRAAWTQPVRTRAVRKQ